MGELLRNAYLVIFPIMLSVGQILFKNAAGRVDASSVGKLVWSLALNPYFIGALVVYGTMTVFWVLALSRHPLSVAYSFIGLSFIFLPILSRVFLQEALSPGVIAGGVLITAGVIVVSASS